MNNKQKIDTEILAVDETMLADQSLPNGIEEQEEILGKQQSNSANNKRIAKNTLLLYFRMMLTMGVSLYTSRVVLEVLGVEDFGVYNVVGGIVVMFGFLNSSMANTTQRYLSFELGKGDFDELKKIFNITVNIHFLIAFVIVLLSETIGLWFLNTKLNIHESRMVAANWVYQFSIATFFMTVISVPYNAAIISHERMNIYAYVSIFEVLAKLGVVYLIKVLGGDKLAIYAGLLFVISAIVRIIYGLYCSRNFKECHYLWVWCKEKNLELLSYAGWNLFGDLAFTLRNQGANILLNIFFGAPINAARGIAYQVSTAIQAFVSGFQTALNPQIVKSFASNDIKHFELLISRGIKLSFFLMFLFTLPVLLHTEYIISLWLTNIPNKTVLFTQLVLIESAINSIPGIFNTAIQASGKIKFYQSIVGSYFLLVLPISFFLFEISFPPETIMILMILFSFIGLFIRLYFLYSILNFPILSFIKETFLRLILVVLVTLSICLIFDKYIYFNETFAMLVSFSCFYSAISIIVIYTFGINKEERKLLNKFLCVIKNKSLR